MPAEIASVEKGATNLLTNCAGTRSGDRLLIIREEPGLGYYDEDVVSAVVSAARRIGAEVTVRQVPFNPRATAIPAEVQAWMGAADQTVFLSRIGDQLRFCDMHGAGHGAGHAAGRASGRAIVCYALDAAMLGSGYGTADYRAFDQLKALLNRTLASARHIKVTCPLGTDFEGPGFGTEVVLQDVGIYRFPMPVFTPVPAADFCGKVALPGFLVGTGSMYYKPYAVEYEGALFANFEAGRITGFSGNAAAVQTAVEHYRQVASTFGIDGDFVHSWHAGIHPGCEVRQPARDNYERWSGSAFGNPRILHFHTCGAYAPGEISWNVIDPTITVDGREIWKDGVLRPDLVPGGAELVAGFSCARALFDAPGRAIGI